MQTDFVKRVVKHAFGFAVLVFAVGCVSRSEAPQDESDQIFARPGDFGADMMHYNPHKTFSGPHGGGGPGILAG